MAFRRAQVGTGSGRGNNRAEAARGYLHQALSQLDRPNQSKYTLNNYCLVFNADSVSEVVISLVWGSEWYHSPGILGNSVPLCLHPVQSKQLS